MNLLAPTPRLPRRSEKQYTTILPDGARSHPKELPCWLDKWAAEKEAAKKEAAKEPGSKVVIPPQMPIEEPELFMSVVVPAYNEEERLEGMLEEAVDYLESQYGNAHAGGKGEKSQKGWEILIVSDGSTDGTVDKALEFASLHLKRTEAKVELSHMACDTFEASTSSSRTQTAQVASLTSERLSMAAKA